MASFERDRMMRFGWNAMRYAIGPLAGLLVPWLVIQRSSVGEWGQIVTTMVLVQLAAHITQWGSRDHLLRQFAISPGSVSDMWRASMIARVIPWLICTLILTRSGLLVKDAWAMYWLLGLVLTNNLEPLIVWRKKFRVAALADALGLAVQIGLILWGSAINAEAIVRSFAANQITRSLMLWTLLGFPSFRHAFKLFDAREYLLSALPFFLTGFSGLLASRADLYMANALLDRTTVGQYQVVTSMFLQFQALAALITTPMTRDLYRLQAGSVSQYAKRLRTWALAGLAPMTAIAWAALTFLFHFDTQWILYLGGALLVWPVFAYVPMINQLYKHGRERSVMWANFAAAGLSALLTFVLLPRVGIAGGLFAAASGQWLMLAWIKHEEHRLQHALPGM